jgi:hypothetical protein
MPVDTFPPDGEVNLNKAIVDDVGLSMTMLQLLLNAFRMQVLKEHLVDRLDKKSRLMVSFRP